ncbi:PstS family phosphate ABC transporter substrate-binding protein [Caldalkalibacillus salinus]|uniref:PstS family phosphate ABC transporter substrate-binding protein n=1 Tax=Caldalkalibacillus salinus TaxID=2803787 RepID=UPI001920D2D2|nr:PstS family phosphate ABC transporter substrate-binding protein [Caldalkalibacillus salinus]
MKQFKWTTMLVALSVLVTLSACGNTEGTSASGDDTLQGSVVIDGSGTVYPFMALMAENYMYNEEEGVSVEVSRAGTSAGFKKFLVDENGTDFNDASRQIKDEEAALAEELGIEVKELKVALDGLTFVVHPDNTWATELTQEEVIQIFLGEKKNWSDIREDFPDEPINTYGPNENHGTYEFFWEEILDEQDLVEGVNLQQEYSTLVDLVSKDEYAIGFFGYGYYVNNTDKISAVNVDFGNGPVEPSLDTIAEDGEYAPFTRPVFTYLNVNLAKEKPQVLDFAIYTMKNAAQVAEETGFAPLPAEDLQKAVEELEALQQ